MIVIEMTARVAFAGVVRIPAFPSSFRRAPGRGLHAGRAQERNAGGTTPASFEPSIDYVVAECVFVFEKFPTADATAAMKSVGEVMAIGAFENRSRAPWSVGGP